MSFTEPEIRQALMEAGSLLPMNAKAVEELERTNPLDDLPLPPGLAFERILGRIHAPRPAAIAELERLREFLYELTFITYAEGEPPNDRKA